MILIPHGSIIFQVGPNRFVNPTGPWALPMTHHATVYICPEQMHDHRFLLKVATDNAKKSTRTTFIAVPNGTMLPATTAP